MAEPHHVKRIDDFVQMGRYMYYVCILAEMIIISQVGSMMYMTFAGASPTPSSCGSVTYDPELNSKEICAQYESSRGNCSYPELSYQFEGVNVEWHLYCSSAKLVKNSISIQMLGVLVGSMVFGQMSDTYGRKTSMLVAMFGTMAGWIVTAHAQSLAQFTVWRTIVGFFTGGHISVFNVFIVENVPKSTRMWINMVITWSPNFPIIAVIAFFSHDWRTYAYVLAVLCLPVIIFLYFFIHESPRWLIQKGRIDEARGVCHSIFATDGRKSEELGEEFEAVLQYEKKLSEEAAFKAKKYTYLHLFTTSKKLALHVTVIAFSYFSTSVINYGVLFNMEKLSGSLYLNTVYSGLTRYVCNLSFGWLDWRFHWMGRKSIHSVGLACIVGAMSAVVAVYAFGMDHSLDTVVRYAILGATAFTSQVYIADGVVGNELFPTPVRNIGYSWLQLSNRLGVVASPFIFYLSDWWIALPYAVMLLLAAVDLTAFHCLLPETKGNNMVEHMPGRKKALPETETLVKQEKTAEEA